MKRKRKALAFLLSVALVVLVVLIIHSIYKRSYYMQDNKWLKFVRNAGFLDSPGVAIDSYTKAIEILERNGVEEQFLERSQIVEQELTIASSDWNEVVNLFIEGAKAKRFGIKIETPEPFTTKIYTANNKRFEFKNFKVLPKAISYLAKVELTQKGNIDKAILLGNANVALGTQLSAYYNVGFVHMYGVAYKDLGLKTLEECARAKDDEDLTKSILEMRQALDKEFEIAKNMPIKVSSRWELFKHTMKNRPDVNDSEKAEEK